MKTLQQRTCFTTEEVQTQSQSQQQGQYPQGNQPQYQKQQNNGQKSYQGKPKPDWLQPRLQVPVSARIQASASRE